MNLRTIVVYLIILFVISGSALSQSQKFEKYARIRMNIDNVHEVQELQSNGINLDHLTGKIGQDITFILNYNEIEILESLNKTFEIEIENMREYYQNRPVPSQSVINKTFELMRKDGIESYTLGSMGGFHTRDEHIAIYNYLHNQYPNLMSSLILIGTSHNGVNIYAVRLSDNPEIQENNEGNVYFDGLIHAREPMSGEVLMYFTYWLLENYGTDPVATYLLNNRQIYIVPVLNPDGYIYNESNDSNGGGMWRKNRRNNGGSFGVDLNRNYGYQWGYDNIGSSNIASSETYRGPSAFSEPETQAARDFILSVNPVIGFNTHTYAGRFINPYGYNGQAVDYEYYSQFAGDFGPFMTYLYGTSPDMISYVSNGTARDWMHHDAGCLTWVPEIGETGFWPTQNQIIPMNSDFLPVLKYVSWVAGDYTVFQNYHIAEEEAIPGDSLSLFINVRNIGLSLNSKNVKIIMSTLNNLATNGRITTVIDSIMPWTSVTSSKPLTFYVEQTTQTMDKLRFKIDIEQDGVVTDRDTIEIYVGSQTVLFSDDAENGKVNWTSSGGGGAWDTTYVGYFSEWHAFSDSRWGNHWSNSNNYLTLNNNIILSGTSNPRVEFYLKFALEKNYDYVRFEISTNNGTSWTPLAGQYTTSFAGLPSYSGMKKGWVHESISLTSYANQNVKFRFRLSTDGGVNGDGFYFDDFRIVDYVTTVTGIVPEVLIADKFELKQNYPNPFNPQTTIKYNLPYESEIIIEIYNEIGEKIKTLVHNTQNSGSFKLIWNGKNDLDKNVASGVYFIKMEAISSEKYFNTIKKCILIR